MTRSYKPRSLPPQHGTRSCYVHGKCRCADCRAANADYANERWVRYQDARRRADVPVAAFPAWDPGVGVLIRYTRVWGTL
jgi:hypothetical protein